MASKAYKQPGCPSIAEWIIELWYSLDHGILFSSKYEYATKAWKDMEKH